MGGKRWMIVVVGVAAACSRPAPAPGNVSPVKSLVASTVAGTRPASSVVWRVYRDVDSLDPIYSIDFPEYTAVSLMCESLLRQAPGGALEPGLATVTNLSPTRLVFTLRPGVKLLGKGLTGAVASFAAMFSPWADSLGGAG